MTSDTRITREMVTRQNLVDKYLMGQMDEQQAMAFEDFYAACPETLEELETTAALMQGMRVSNPGGDAVAFHRPAPPVGSGRWLRRHWFGIAATLVAVIAVATRVPVSDAEAPAMANLVNMPVVTLSPVRGEEATGIRIPRGHSDVIVLSLDLGFAESDAYVAEVRNTDDELLLTSDTLVPNDAAIVSLFLTGATVASGDYAVSVRRTDGKDEPYRFSYTVTD